MRVLVTGASGLIGCHAAHQLLNAGMQVRALAREPKRVEAAIGPLFAGEGLPPDLEIVRGDVMDRDSVYSALQDCEGFLHAAGLFSPAREDEPRLKTVNIEGTRNALGAAAQARGEAQTLSRVVYVSSMLALFPPSGAQIRAADPVAHPQSMYASTKAEAERIARHFQESLPLTILYPAAVHGPFDPTFSVGPQLIAQAVQSGSVLVTEGGLAYSDVRDVARTLVSIFEDRCPVQRLMAPSMFLPHDRYRGLLETIEGRPFSAQRIPGWVLRAAGRLGDLAQKVGFAPQLNFEAAEVLTRSVPLDDREARQMLDPAPFTPEASFRDVIAWMRSAGHLTE